MGKREIARAFKISGADRIDLKRMLRKMADQGLLGEGPQAAAQVRHHSTDCRA